MSKIIFSKEYPPTQKKYFIFSSTKNRKKDNEFEKEKCITKCATPFFSFSLELGVGTRVNSSREAKLKTCMRLC